MGSEVCDLIHCTKFLLRLTYLLVQSVFIWIIQLVEVIMSSLIVSINGNKIIIFGIVPEFHVSDFRNDISRVWAASKVTQIAKFMGPTWGPRVSLLGKMSVNQTLYIHLYCIVLELHTQCGAIITRSIFSKNPHKRHSTACLWGRDMECLLWI